MKVIKVVAAIIQHDGKILATQRGYGDFKGGWEFPGGKIEAGETPEQALKREIKEELRANIQVEDLLCTVEYDYPKFHLSMDCFMCTLKDEHLELTEHSSARWLTKDQLDSVDWLPADLDVVDCLKKNLEDDE